MQRITARYSVVIPFVWFQQSVASNTRRALFASRRMGWRSTPFARRRLVHHPLKIGQNVDGYGSFTHHCHLLAREAQRADTASHLQPLSLHDYASTVVSG